jgi:hypothetical protein
MDGAATVTATVTAADVTIENCIFKAGHADIAKCFDVTAKRFTLRNCDFLENVATENFLIVVSATGAANTADGLTIENCTYIGADTANTQFVSFTNDVDRFVFKNNYVSMGVNDAAGAIISAATGKDFTNCIITNNMFYRLNTTGTIAVSSDTTANSGIVAYNVAGHADTADEVLFDVSGARLFENYGVAVNDKQGYLVPAVDS